MRGFGAKELLLVHRKMRPLQPPNSVDNILALVTTAKAQTTVTPTAAPTAALNSTSDSV